VETRLKNQSQDKILEKPSPKNKKFQPTIKTIFLKSVIL